MKNEQGFYFQSYAEWKQALTQRCNINLTPEYAQSRIIALNNTDDRDTKEFVAKYGDAYLKQVIQWFEQAANES